MEKRELLELFRVDDLRLLPESMMQLVISNSPERDEVYRRLLEINNYDVSYDWFQSIYEGEMSERREKKQDFTPNSIGQLVSALTGQTDGSTHEPTAGNGGMLIADWWRKALSHIPFNFYPSKNPIECWELSDRSIPILLLNLSIRGIVGTVRHGDVLEKNEKHRYRLVNETDNALGFSKIIVVK